MPSAAIRDALNAAFEHHQAGEFDLAENLYQAVLQHEPDEFNALQLLGALVQARGRPEEAIKLLERAMAVGEARSAGGNSAVQAVLHNNLGNALRAAGRVTDAALHYRRGLEIDPQLAELNVNLGNALMAVNDFAGAIESYETARRERPLSTRCLHNLGTACMQINRFADAIEAFRHCLEADPDHADALHDLGVLLAKVGLESLAVPILERATLVRPDDAGSHTELGNILQATGDAERAFASFRRACELRPITTWRAGTQPADFAVLLIASPGAGNTPPDFLFRSAGFDRHFYAVLPDTAPDFDMLRSHGDIAVNLISDVDQGGPMLSTAADLLDRLGKPTVNHPRAVLATGRDTITALLSGLPWCRVPRTIRCVRAALAAPGASDYPRQHGIDFPLLLRVAGTHGGDTFEKMSSADDIAAFLERHPAESFYATEYIDYRSLDGYFRKYRFIVTDGEILPYHLAIAEEWKVHHYRTDMIHHAWMQDEERLFLDNPGLVFSKVHYATLAKIAAAIGLDFLGIDCALDRDDNLVVFEVNASMLIHDDNADFPYKTPHCERIKDAVQAMLTRKARPHAHAVGRVTATHDRILLLSADL